MQRLTSSSRQYPLAALIIFLLFIISSCGESSSVTDSVSQDVSDPIEVTFASDSTSFTPGQIVSLSVSGTQLDNDAYPASVGGQDILLYNNQEDVSQNSLIFLIPETDAGSAELSFVLDQTDISLSFSIVDYEAIVEPEQYVTDRKTEIVALLSNALERTDDEQTQELIETLQTDLDGAISDFQNLTEPEQKQIAYTIREYIQSADSEPSSAGKSVNSSLSRTEDIFCSDTVDRLSSSPKRVLAATFPGGSAGAIGGTGGSILKLFSISALFSELSSVIDDLEFYFDECIAPELSLDSFGNSKAVNPLAFTHNEEQTYVLNESKSLDQEISDILAQIESAVSGFISELSDAWVDYLFENNFISSRPADSSLYSLLDITDDDILYNVTPSDSTVSFTFEYPKDALSFETRSFSFTFGNEESTLDVDVNLAPPVPTPFALNSFGAAGETITDTVKADFADRFFPTSEPGIGSIRSFDEETGVFTYRADAGLSGTDTFTFKAVNSSGESEDQTINITLDSGYIVQIGNYNPTYELIEPIQTIRTGDNLTLPNFMSQMVRLLYKGQPVNVGSYGLPWTSLRFGTYPQSSENLIYDDYELRIYDATNNRTVTTRLNRLTLTNEAFSIVVNSRFRIGGESITARIYDFKEDGSYESWYASDESGKTQGTYIFYNVVSHSNVNCNNEYTITKPKIGAIKYGGLGSDWIMIYADGSVSANSFYGCTGQYNHIPIERL